MIWFFSVKKAEILENKLALKARLDAEYLTKSEIRISEDYIDIDFHDHPYKGFLLHLKKKPDGSISGYIHHFNPIFLGFLAFLLVMILSTDLVNELISSLDEAIFNPLLLLGSIFVLNLLSFFYRSYTLLKRLRLNT